MPGLGGAWKLPCFWRMNVLCYEMPSSKFLKRDFVNSSETYKFRFHWVNIFYIMILVIMKQTFLLTNYLTILVILDILKVIPLDGHFLHDDLDDHE